MSYLDILLDFIEAPEEAAREIGAVRPVGLGLVAYSAAGLNWFLVHALTHSGSFLRPGWLLLVAICAGQVLLGFISTAVLHLLADIFGAQGPAMGLFILWGLCNLVWTVAVPAVLVAGFLCPAQKWLVPAVFLLLGFGNFYLKARSIRDNYGVSSKKAWLILSFPYLAVIGVSSVLAGFAAWRIFSTWLS